MRGATNNGQCGGNNLRVVVSLSVNVFDILKDDWWYKVVVIMIMEVMPLMDETTRP